MAETPTAENGLPPERYDDPWDFTVTWSPESTLPNPILRLFRGRSTVRQGEAVKRTDKGHATFYASQVDKYVRAYHPTRSDITATATRVTPPAKDPS